MASLIESGSQHISSVGMAMVTSRAMTEAQAGMFLAKQYPRDEEFSLKKIGGACRRRLLAESSMYEYTRGGSQVRGPSIRLAEALAQCWGNIDFGFTELERTVGRDGVGQSSVQAYAVDLENNVRRAVTFTVRHWRDTKRGGAKVTEERDLYEMIASAAQRRVRACILAVLPGDIVDYALQECDKTLMAASDDPVDVRVQRMVEAFATEGVTVAQLEKFMNHAIGATTTTEVVRLGKIYTSIRDRVAPASHWFGEPEQPKNGNGNGRKKTGDLASLLDDQEDDGEVLV